MSKGWCLWLLCFAAQGTEIGGRIKLGSNWQDNGSQSLSQALGHQTSSEANAQLRLTLSHTIDSWTFDAAWQLDARAGSGVALDNDLSAAFPGLETQSDNSLWDMQSSWSHTRHSELEQRIDRLNIGYSGDNLVLRLGRQALTWGAGQVFHPMDLVNPFQPVQLDTAYKLGTDMAYAQWLFDSGADVQFALVPHRSTSPLDTGGGKPTQAAFASIPGETLQWTILVANDQSEATLGIGTSGPWQENVWNLQWVGTKLDTGGYANSVLFNLTRAGVIWQGNYTAFVEYYHNGFGQSQHRYDLLTLDPALSVRLQRGQQFVTARDYLALGASWEWTPLIQLIPSVIVNLNDSSALFDTQLSWSLSDNLTFKADLRLPIGNRGSEFGGLALIQDQPPYLAQPKQLQLQLERYF